MNLVIVILTVCLVQVSAATFGQRITLSESNAPLEQVLKKIKLQSGVNFLYADDLFENVRKVHVKLNNGTLEQALSKVFEDQPVSYEIQQNTVIVKLKEPSFLERVVDAFTPPIDVRGIVLDEKGLRLAGANVKVKGFKQAAVTDDEGRFYLPEVDDKAVLIVSFVGYKDVEVGAKASLSIALELKAAELDEVVVAYGKTTQQALTGSVTVVKGEEIQNLPGMSVDKRLQGLVPGLLVTSGTGQPGGGLANFVLRGIATASNGGNSSFSTLRNPLIVVDGVPVFQDAQIGGIRNRPISEVPNNNPMARFSPSDIESISVLKDAAAIALYGSTASNGVILITTKKGKAGKTTISFSSQLDVASRIKTDIELVNQQEYLELLYETYRNTTPGITDATILTDLKAKFPTRSDGSFYPYTDLTPLLYNNNATTLGNNLAISGGNDRTAFYTNFEWTKENGIFRTTGFDRKSLRFNFDHRLFTWMKIGLNSTLSYNLQDVAPYTNNQPVFGSIFYAYPLNPVYQENGDQYLNYTVPSGGINPVAAIKYNKSRNTGYSGLNSLYGELTITKDIKFKSMLGIDYLTTETKTKNDPRLVDPVQRKIGVGRIYEANIRNANLISTNTLNFTKVIAADHTLSLLAGQEARMTTKKAVTVEGMGLRFYTDDQINGVSTTDSRGTEEKQTALSYFGQLNYGFRNKYFLSGSIRADGYSQFGDKQPFNVFGSIGAGWIVSDEFFMKGTQRWLDYLKIRGSFGPAGNAAAIDRYTKYQQLFPLNYLDAATIAIITDGIKPANPLIKPERTTTWDMGLELKLWNGRISLNADAYVRKTVDLIYETDLPLSSGFTSVIDNLGDIVNKGIELSFSADLVKSKRFVWSMAGNWSINRNKLIRSNNPLPVFQLGSNVVANAEGHNFNSFYMREWAGVDPATGSGMWIDSLGKPNTNYFAAKEQWFGKPQPDGFGSITNSLNYKGISFSFQLYYQYGFQLYNSDRSLINDGSSIYDNQAKQALNRWQKPGDIAVNPKRRMFNPDYSKESTRNLIDGDYIRLQMVSLGYSLPQDLIQRLHLNSFRIYAQGYNLATWSVKKTGSWDVGNANVMGQLSNQYPIAKSFSVGINVGF